MVQCAQEHTQHGTFVGLHGSKAADDIDHENDTKMSWTEALGSLDLATAMRVGGGGGSGTPTGRSLSRLVLVQLAPVDDRVSVLVLVLRSTGV